MSVAQFYHECDATVRVFQLHMVCKCRANCRGSTHFTVTEMAAARVVLEMRCTVTFAAVYGLITADASERAKTAVYAVHEAAFAPTDKTFVVIQQK